jgi:hypothetical protein
MRRSELFDRLYDDDQGKWDEIHPLHDLSMSGGSLAISQEGAGPRSLELNQWATTQLCQQLSIPTTYFRRCPSDLQDLQVNHWLKETMAREAVEQRRRSNGPTQWLIRGKGENVRGILSDRYSRLDNVDLIPILEPYLFEGYQIESCSVTEVSFHLRLIRPDSRRLIRLGDEAMAGLHISNSEVGLRALTVDSLVYRLVCTNGLILTVNGKSHLHQRHVGVSENGLSERFRGAVTSALSSAQGGLDAFEASVRELVEDPEAAIAEIAEKNDFSEDFSKLVSLHLQAEPASVQMTRFGLVNALTSAAQTRESPDERYRVEAIAGRLLN